MTTLFAEAKFVEVAIVAVALRVGHRQRLKPRVEEVPDHPDSRTPKRHDRSINFRGARRCACHYRRSVI
jgi:hypothetical protein